MLDAAHVFMCHPIIDVSIDALAVIFVGEILS